MLNQRFKQLINWKLFFILWGAAMLSVAAILPYVFEVQKATLTKVPLPLPLLISLILVQNSLIFALIIAAGMWFAKRTGLGLPIMELILAKQPINISWRKTLGLSVILGLASGVAIVLLDFLFRYFGAVVPIDSGTDIVWRGLLASFYGGIAEEVFMRLGLMSFLVWLLLTLFKPGKNSVVMWSAIIIISLLFGLGHLPITATLTPLTPLVILRAIILNGIGGVVFGWLFWKRGLESAIFAHFSADIILHVVMPALG